MSETEKALDQLVSAEILQKRIANLVGRRTLALVENDASYDPESYDPAYDEDETELEAA